MVASTTKERERRRLENDLKNIFGLLSSRRNLSCDQARWVFEQVMTGILPESTIGALLGALIVKGECVDELVGAAQAMRASAIAVSCPSGAIDTCGTGGDGISTFNVSTTAAVIAAAAGATVAKHGNRSTTRASGSTEVLTHLGIDVDADVTIVERSLAEVGIGYLNARRLHPAMKYAAPIRAAIPVRTIFNLLGPLTNPAGVVRQVIGVPEASLTEKMAQVLDQLGAVHAWVVHGDDGLCDLTISSSTTVVELREGTVRRFSVSPEDVGLQRGCLDDLRVDSPQHSAEMVRAVLAGQPGAPRDHALLNAGAALVVAGIAGELRLGVELAASAVDGGGALETLKRWTTIAGIAS